MAAGFNTQAGNGQYRLQFETDNKEDYLLMQKLARLCVDGKTSEILKIVEASKEKSPCETCMVSTYPEGCQKKHCTSWKKWWISRWELIRAYGEMHKAQFVP